jgi:hypothetical protein
MKLTSTFLGAVIGMALSTSAFASPILYLFDGDNSAGLIVNTNTSSYTTFATFSRAYPVAIINNTILLQNRDDLVSGGATYDLSGNLTGSLAGQGTTVSQLLDGTTNGVNNFAVQCCATSNSVWEADLSWQNFTPLFSLGTTGGFGISYDSALNVLFVVDGSGNLSEYSMTGTLLNSYAVAGGINSGLSYDPVTDTLWGTINGTDSVLQESTTGTVLQTLTVTGLSGYNIWGGEIGGSAVPEPATLLVGPALLALYLGRKRLAR